MRNTIDYIVISDIHLGHNKNSTGEIVNNLKIVFKENHAIFKKLSVIFLAGDVFDKLLTTHSDNYVIALSWVAELIMYCKVNNIKLRILEGTPGHDWKQIKLLYTIHSKLLEDVDFKYIETLEIEVMEDLGLSVLYVPDEYNEKATDTYLEILELLKKNNLEQVDIAMMHGHFGYQLPMFESEASFVENDMLAIVKNYISIGHVHTFSVYDRIIAQGSFDRLAHNEEEDKGLVYISLSPDGNSFYFIKNKNSKLFKTYTYTSTDVDFIIKDIGAKVKKLADNSHVRLIVPETLILKQDNLKTISAKYANIHFKIEHKKKKTNEETELFKEQHIVSFHITRDNIVSLLNTEMDKHTLTKEEYAEYTTELAKCI